MSAPTGNKFWEARTKHGRDRVISDPAVLWAAAVEYFQWVDENPLWEDKIVTANGEPVSKPLFKMRAMTLEGLCRFLGIGRSTWNTWREGDDDDFLEVVQQIDDVIREQKFSGAAAGLLNANIIARDLGLADKQDVNQKTHHSGQVKMSNAQADALLIEAGIDPETLQPIKPDAVE